jgi:hypothetical protein
MRQMLLEHDSLSGDVKKDPRIKDWPEVFFRDTPEGLYVFDCQEALDIHTAGKLPTP